MYKDRNLKGAIYQYDKKVGTDYLNQLPVLFDKSLRLKTEDVLTKYYVFHHFGLSLNKGGMPIKVDKRECLKFHQDVRKSKLDQAQVAKKMYELEFNQQEYFIRQVLKFFKINKDKRVLDLGSGSGALAFFLAEKYKAQVDGINLSNKQVKLTNRVANIKGVDKSVKFYVANFNKPLVTKKKVSRKKYDLILQSETDIYVDNLNKFYKLIHSYLGRYGYFASISWNCVKKASRFKSVIDKYYSANMKSVLDIEIGLKRAGMKIVCKQDLTQAAKPYWYLRNLFYHSKGIVESEFIGGYECGALKYMLYIAKRSWFNNNLLVVYFLVSGNIDFRNLTIGFGRFFL